MSYKTSTPPVLISRIKQKAACNLFNGEKVYDAGTEITFSIKTKLGSDSYSLAEFKHTGSVKSEKYIRRNKRKSGLTLKRAFNRALKQYSFLTSGKKYTD